MNLLQLQVEQMETRMKTRFMYQQIAFALLQAVSGVPIAEITRKMGISNLTLYGWKKQLTGSEGSEIHRLKGPGDENPR